MIERFELSDLEADLLVELFNIGVGRAAGSLSRMVNQEIKLSVPSVEFCSTQEVTEFLGGQSIYCSVSQTITGAFDAKSMLLFLDENGKEVVRQLLGSHLSEELITEMQEDALNEIGNIVLNACIGAIATNLDIEFEVALPVFEKGDPMTLLMPSSPTDNDIVLLIKIQMHLSECEINGFLVFMLGPSSQQDLQKSLNIMLEKVSG